MRHGYLFDLDGTLVDTHSSNLGAYREAISRVVPSARVDDGELLARISAGHDSASFLPDLIPGLTAPQLAEIKREKALCYPRHVPASVLNAELVGRARAWGREPGSAIVLVTTAKRANAENVLAFHGIGDLFDFRVFGEDVARLKPAPDIYLRALEVAGLRAGEAEAFEDSDAGIAAARAAGIAVTRVDWAGA